jgi:hypothetical protein
MPVFRIQVEGSEAMRAINSESVSMRLKWLLI